jgi:hypothetical protein
VSDFILGGEETPSEYLQNERERTGNGIAAAHRRIQELEAQVAALAQQPLSVQEPVDPASLDIDDGAMTFRSGTISITAFAETAIVYDTSKKIPARKVKLSPYQFFEDAADILGGAALRDAKERKE